MSNILKCKLSTRYSLVHILPTWSSQNAPSTANRALAIPSCALFVHNFPRLRRETTEAQTLLQWPQDAQCPNKHRVSRPKVFSPVNPRVPELDDGWLPWWCECSPCTTTTLRNSEVFKLNFLWFTNHMIFGDVKVRCNALCQLQWGLGLGWGTTRCGNLPIYYLILRNKMSNAVNKYIYLIYIYMYIFLQLQTPSETVFGVVSWGLNTFSEGIGSTRVHIYMNIQWTSRHPSSLI